MKHFIHYLKTFRKRTGVSLQDMASIIGIDAGHLSKIESGQLNPPVIIILSYQLILKIPIERLLKNHYPELTNLSLVNAQVLKEELLQGEVTAARAGRITKLDIVIDRLLDLKKHYAA